MSSTIVTSFLLEKTATNIW